MQEMTERWSCRWREGEETEQKEKVAYIQYIKNKFQQNQGSKLVKKERVNWMMDL